MPKGDRFKLKADPEDGTTPIANLLLEAVAMAKLSGQEKGAILYLWRETSGCMTPDKKHLEECKLTLSQWGTALNVTRFRASHILANLVSKNIFSRRIAKQWGGYYYWLNTNIASWNSGTINLTKLASLENLHICFDCNRCSVLIHEHHLDGEHGKTKPKETIRCCPRCHRIRHNKTTISLDHSLIPIYAYPRPLHTLAQYSYLKIERGGEHNG